MQNLKRNWLVIPNLTWGIWRILTRALESLKNFLFNRLLLNKLYIVSGKKYRGVIFPENEEGCKINLFFFQNWRKQFDKFWHEHSKVSNIFTLIGSLWEKYISIELKKYRRVIFHENEEGFKIWKGIHLSFHNWHKEFDKFWPEHSKSQEFSL